MSKTRFNSSLFYVLANFTSQKTINNLPKVSMNGYQYVFLFDNYKTLRSVFRNDCEYLMKINKIILYWLLVSKNLMLQLFLNKWNWIAFCVYASVFVPINGNEDGKRWAHPLKLRNFFHTKNYNKQSPSSLFAFIINLSFICYCANICQTEPDFLFVCSSI